MNFLGHLYFSNDDDQLKHANLFGDFVRGKDLTMYPREIAEGIVLHRTIDQYIDHHPVVLELLHQLYGDLPKISGIAVDLYFDHLLARNWNEYHGEKINQFIHNFYTKKIDKIQYYSDEYLFVYGKMKEYDWLGQYSSHQGLTKACQGLNRRISFENSLDRAPQVFLEKEKIITDAFHAYMNEANQYFSEYFKNS